MSKSRMAVLVAIASLAVSMLGAGSAAAQTAPLKQTMPLTGSKGFKGTFTIDRFAQRGGKTVALGTVKGKLRGKSVTKRNVAIPATVTRQAAAPSPTTPGVPVPAAPAKSSQLLPPTPGACQILNLVLGPIDLNLLGLRIRTNTINVRIEGVPGAGNLLGNLLCAITGILDPGRITNAQLIALLNAILALLPR